MYSQEERAGLMRSQGRPEERLLVVVSWSVSFQETAAAMEIDLVVLHSHFVAYY